MAVELFRKVLKHCQMSTTFHIFIYIYALVNIFLVLKIAQMLLATGWILRSNLTWEFVPTDLNKER